MNNEFILSNGVSLPIVQGFREQVKSNWRNATKILIIQMTKCQWIKSII